ncbi:MAG: septal ring lytic transglycosylase RlpA family protein [Bacteroidetes bacterium]|nr:septal ring lytic transglycosylase RlpA family protein [Bacteroidota bacterium]
MTTAISMRTLVRLVIFACVFLAVMSVSFLVEARDLPASVRTDNADTAIRENVREELYFPMDEITDGLASWYGREFHGRRTASGRTYNMNEYTAAHRNLPFGSLIRVANPVNGKVMLVEVTDRGPFVRKRVVDLSYAAAQHLKISVSPVELMALTPRTIHDFYCDNDSTVLAIDANMTVRVIPTAKLETTTPATTFTRAMTGRNATDAYVVIVPPDASNKAMRYAVAERITSVVPDVAIR